MFELAGALIGGLITLQGIKFLLARGIVFGSRNQKPERDAKRRPVHPRWTRTERTPRGQQPAEQEREAERWRERQWVSKAIQRKRVVERS